MRGDVAGKHYGYKAHLGYMETPATFVFATNDQLQIASVDFGTPRPAPGVYTVGAKANAAQKLASVSFLDSSGKQLLGWDSAAKAGSITVSLQYGYLYLKARDLRLAPTGLHNTGALKQPLVLGFEGALVPD